MNSCFSISTKFNRSLVLLGQWVHFQSNLPIFEIVLSNNNCVTLLFILQTSSPHEKQCKSKTSYKLTSRTKQLNYQLSCTWRNTISVRDNFLHNLSTNILMKISSSQNCPWEFGKCFYPSCLSDWIYILETKQKNNRDLNNLWGAAMSANSCL